MSEIAIRFERYQLHPKYHRMTMKSSESVPSTMSKIR
jgi:hypothetical protein